MDTIKVFNKEDFPVYAELRWGVGTVDYCTIEPNTVGELNCKGAAAWFDIDIRMLNSEKTWIAGAKMVPRNTTLTLTHHTVWDLNLD